MIGFSGTLLPAVVAERANTIERREGAFFALPCCAYLTYGAIRG